LYYSGIIIFLLNGNLATLKARPGERPFHS